MGNIEHQIQPMPQGELPVLFWRRDRNEWAVAPPFHGRARWVPVKVVRATEHQEAVDRVKELEREIREHRDAVTGQPEYVHAAADRKLHRTLREK